MKIEVLAARSRERPLSLRERLIAYLPRYAPNARRFAPLLNLPNQVPALARMAERITGFSAKRKLPKWQGRAIAQPSAAERTASAGRTVALFADTFNRNFEPDNLDATVAVLNRLGYAVEILEASSGHRPLCCGRTFLSAGLVDEARTEAGRLLEAVRPHLAAGTPIIGIEPSCLLTLRDEFLSLKLGAEAEKLASQAVMLEEFLVNEVEAGRIAGPIGQLEQTVHLHTHCHQKAFGVAGPVEQALRLVGGLTVKPIDSGCCGMAGSFGYQAETYDTSMAMGELALFPAVRKAAEADIIAADGFSCRHQIADGAERQARHVAQILLEAMQNAGTTSSAGG